MQKPQYTVTFEQRPDYLFARVKATEITQELAIQYMKEMTTRCRELNLHKLLIVREIPQMMSVGTLFFIAQEFNQMTEGIKVAYEIPYPGLFDDMNFAVTTATNRGGRFAFFPNESSAEKWLMDGH